MEAQGQSGVKYIVIGVAGVIAILVTVKQLGFTPTKITTPGVSVELSGGLAPRPSQQNDPPATQNTSQLESRVHELESQLRSAPQQTPPPSNAVSEPNAPQPNQIPNVAGTWRNQLLTVQMSQNGASVVDQTFMYGNLASVGKGFLNGNRLSLTYTNNLMITGRAEATVSPDGTQMNVTDYGSGYPQNFQLTRVQ